MKPDPATYNPSPEYLRSLVKKARLSQRKCAEALGVSERTFRFWLSGHGNIPYHAQFTLECIAEQARDD